MIFFFLIIIVTAASAPWTPPPRNEVGMIIIIRTHINDGNRGIQLKYNIYRQAIPPAGTSAWWSWWRESKNELSCSLSVRRTGIRAITRRTVRARLTVFQPVTLCCCSSRSSGDKRSGKTSERESEKERVTNDDRSLASVLHGQHTRKWTPKTRNGYREQPKRRTTGNDGQTRNERLDKRERQRRRLASAATRRAHARAAITKNHRCRVPAGARASVVLLLWSPPAHPPTDESTNPSTEHNTITS